MKILLLSLFFLTLHVRATPVEVEEGGENAVDYDYGSQESAVRFLAAYNEESLRLNNLAIIASWNHATNITDHNAEQSRLASEKSSDYEAEAGKEAAKFDTTNFSDEVKKRMGLVGSTPLPDEQRKELSEVLSQLSTIYASTKVEKFILKSLARKCFKMLLLVRYVWMSKTAMASLA